MFVKNNLFVFLLVIGSISLCYGLKFNIVKQGILEPSESEENYHDDDDTRTFNSHHDGVQYIQQPQYVTQALPVVTTIVQHQPAQVTATVIQQQPASTVIVTQTVSQPQYVQPQVVQVPQVQEYVTYSKPVHNNRKNCPVYIVQQPATQGGTVTQIIGSTATVTQVATAISTQTQTVTVSSCSISPTSTVTSTVTVTTTVPPGQQG